MSKTKQETIKELEALREKAQNPDIKKSIEDKLKYINKPVKK